MALLKPKFASFLAPLTCLKSRRFPLLWELKNLVARAVALGLSLCLLTSTASASEASALLKLAQRLSIENLNTAEDYASVLSYRLTSESFQRLKKEIPNLAFKDSKELAEKLRSFHHYKATSRMRDLDITMLAKVSKLQGEIQFTEEDLNNLSSDRSSDRYSAFLAQVSGGRGQKRKLLAVEYAELIKNSYVTASIPLFPDQTVKKMASFKSPPQMKWIPSFEEYKNYRKSFQALNQEERILQFHRQARAPEAFAIVDKKRNKLKIFSSSTELIETRSARTFRGDELNSGGAGIYRATDFRDGYQFLAAKKDLEIRGQLGLEQALPKSFLVYILPETSQHQFFIRDGSLVFMADKTSRQRQAYNYAAPQTQPSEIRFSEDAPSSFLKTYLETLSSEKTTIQKLMKTEDDDYNIAAELALGILAPETGNGESLKYKLKEMAPWVISLLKGNGLDTEQNSRGPTQIKNIPDAVEAHYHISKQDLKEPRVAAIATVAFCLELLRDLRNISYLHPQIHEANLQDYLYYLYQGRRFEIRNGTATPDKNKSIQKIFKQIKEFPLTRTATKTVLP